MSAAATDSDKDGIMNGEYVISGIIGLGLLVYLTVALLRPEKF
jgi:K+-transporting ATPase KdpF subunit